MANGWDQFPQADAPAASGWDMFPAEQQTASLDTGAGRFAAPQMQGVPLPDVPPAPPRRQAEMRSYEPTWRENIAQYMMGDSRASPERERLVRGVMGTTGLPGSEQIGAVDFTPARIPLFAQEAKRAYDEGNYGSAALNAVGAVPIPLVDKAVGGAVKGLRRLGTTADDGARGLVQGAGEVTEEAVKQAPRRMSPEELKTASRAAYKEADEAGVIFTPAGVARVSKEAKEALAEFGYQPELHPQVRVALKVLDEMAGGNVTFKGMDTLRKVVKAAANSTKDEERKAGMMIIEKIDDLMANSRQMETIAGSSEKAGEAIKRARELWGRARRTELIEESVVRAERRAGSTGSGGNIDNATRQNLRRLLDDPKKARMFTKAERELIDKVVRGTKGLNTLRQLGKLSPEGNGLMLMGHILAGVASAPVNPIGTALVGASGAIGAVSKRLADRGTNRAVNNLITDVSSGSKRNALSR
jgi:hypothetical protein